MHDFCLSLPIYLKHLANIHKVFQWIFKYLKLSESVKFSLTAYCCVALTNCVICVSGLTICYFLQSQYQLWFCLTKTWNQTSKSYRIYIEFIKNAIGIKLTYIDCSSADKSDWDIYSSILNSKFNPGICSFTKEKFIYLGWLRSDERGNSFSCNILEQDLITSLL